MLVTVSRSLVTLGTHSLPGPFPHALPLEGLTASGGEASCVSLSLGLTSVTGGVAGQASSLTWFQGFLRGSWGRGPILCL